MPQDYHGTALVKKWIDAFKNKSATDRLTADELSQLNYDINLAHNQFKDEVLKIKK